MLDGRSFSNWGAEGEPRERCGDEDGQAYSLFCGGLVGTGLTRGLGKDLVAHGA